MPTKSLYLGLLCLLSFSVEAGPLSQLCEHGLHHHPQILSKDYVQRSKAYVYDQGRDQYLPQITLSAETGHTNYLYEYPQRDIWHHDNFSDYTLSVTQAVYQPVLLKKITDAQEREILARYQTEDQKANLATQIALTSIELLRLRQIRELAKKKITLYRKAYEEIQSKFKSRFADVSAVAQARARLRQSEADFARYNQMYRYTYNNLKFLSDVKKIPASLTRKNFNALAVTRYYRSRDLGKYLKMIHQNTQVRVYRKYRDIAKNLIEMRRAEHYPTLSVRASYRDGHYDDPGAEHRNSRISLNFNLPIYQGGYVRDRVNEAQALYYAAMEDLNNALLQSRSSLEKNWEQVRTGLETLKALRAAEKASKVYYETSVNAYKNGLQSLTDTYQANIDYYDTKVRRINAEADLLSSLIKLYYTTGLATPRQLATFERRYLR
jgi:outer membrane protein